MEVGFSEEQTLLRESARDFLAGECPMSLVRAQMDDARGLPDTLWNAMAALGWCGLIVPEQYGGSGLGLVDLSVVLEEMGRVLCPGPFVSTAVVGATALIHGGSPDQRARWLPELSAGRLRVALAQLEDSASWGADAIRLRAEPRDAHFALNGTKRFVVDAPCAEALLVAARSAEATNASGRDGISVFWVDSNADGVSIRSIPSNEQTRKTAEVVFEDVAVGADRLLGSPGAGWPLLECVHDRARVALTAELAGAAQRVLEQSVDYAKAREQFGQPIGRFQSIQHKCADMLIGVEGTRSAAWYAAWALDQDEPGAATATRLAKAYASDTALAVAGDGIQIHGGLGFTWEQDLHLYYKHAQAMALAYGSPTELRALAADELIGPVLSAAAPARAGR